MEETIRFQNGLQVTDIEKSRDCDTENIKIYKTAKDLFDNYIYPIQSGNNLKYKLKSYNEFTFNKKIKLFFDIDLLKKDFNNDIEFKTYFDEANKIKDDFLGSELIMLKNLILEFVLYFNKRKNLILKYVKGENVLNVTNDVFKKNENYSKSILSNISVTKSNNEEKLSFHVYFNNLIYLRENSHSIKNFIREFIEKSKNPLSKYIDTNPYKAKPLLRFIYSTKSETDFSYHIPISCLFNTGELEIEYETVDLDEVNVTNYLYSYVDSKIQNFEIVIKEKLVSGNELHIKEGIEPIELNDFTLPDINFLTYKSILNRIFKSEDLAIFKQFGILENFEFFDNRKLNSSEDEILLKFDYSKTSCVFCKKPSHKNPHRIYINNYGIVVVKTSISARCIKKAYSLPALSELQICDWIFNKGIIKRLKSNELIIFSDLYGWETINITDYSSLKYIVKTYSHHFKIKDQETIENIKEATLRECFKSISKKIPITNLSYHNYFKFKNGVLDIATGKFYLMKDSKDLIVINGVDYNYKPIEEYNNIEKEKHRYLNQVIDQILPPILKDEKNINRDIFEQNVSSCILTVPKDVITVFQGETSAGKSTIKNLICSSLGKHNFLELPITTYTFPINPNKPNPWLGKISYKLASFASEPGFRDKINSQTVKLMTEVEIQARLLNSNDQEQTNCLSQFIDTNPELLFDRDDPATLRRWAVVRFQTTFKSDNNQPLLTVFEKQSYKSSETLKQDIIDRKYALIFFNILREWCIKYKQFTHFSMKNTCEFAEYSLFLEFFSKCLVSSVLVKSTQYIREEALDNYKTQLLRFGKETNEYIITDYNYMFKMLNAVIKNKNWKVDLIQFLKQLELKIKHRTIYTYIFLCDIKEEYYDEIIEEYNKRNKDKTKPALTLEYFNENKDLTNVLNTDEDEEQNIKIE